MPKSNAPEPGHPLHGLAAMSLATIARKIQQDWQNPYFGAKPYIKALTECHDMKSMYGQELGYSVVLGFLVNASTWRGEHARLIKAELKKRVKEHEKKS